MALAGAFLAGGCVPKSGPALPQPVSNSKGTQWDDSAAAQRVRDLSRDADNLSADARLLPGNDAAEHSRMMQRIFTDLLQCFTLLRNPADDRVMAQRMLVIQTSRAQLAAGARESEMAPSIDNALRAAWAELADLSHADGFEQADVGPTLDKLLAQIDRHDFERDPALHRVDVAEATDLVSQVVSKLAAALAGRLTAQPTASQPAASMPAESQPTAAPMEAPPATQPVPATQP